MINLIRRFFCAHDFRPIGSYNLHRDIDYKVIGIAHLQRCEKCGKVESTKTTWRA